MAAAARGKRRAVLAFATARVRAAGTAIGSGGGPQRFGTGIIGMVGFSRLSVSCTRPGWPGGAHPGSGPLLAGGPASRRTHDSKRPLASFPNRASQASTLPPSRSRIALTSAEPAPYPPERAARCSPPRANSCPGRIPQASLNAANRAAADPRSGRVTDPPPSRPPHGSPRHFRPAPPAGPPLDPAAERARPAA